MTIRVDARLFRFAGHCVSKEETRYYLQGVYIEPHPEKGALMVSTDGHRMVVAYDPDGDCDETAIVMLPKPALDLAKDHSKGAKDVLELPAWEIDVKGKSASLVRDGNTIATYEDILIDGEFPNWRGVLPVAPASVPVGLAGFNPVYLAGFGKLGDEIGKAIDRSPSIRLFSAGGAPEEPALIRWDGIDDVFGILMPTKVDDRSVGFPEFMAPAAPRPKRATASPSVEAAEQAHGAEVLA